MHEPGVRDVGSAPKKVVRGLYRIRKWAPCSASGPSDYRAEESNDLKGKVKVERQLVGLPWAADCCPWVGKLRTNEWVL